MSSSPLCPRVTSFCCFFSLRSGANFIGWFTYLANALYIVAVVKSIAGTQNAVDFMEDKLDGTYRRTIFPQLIHLAENVDGCNDDTRIQKIRSTLLDQEEWAAFLRKNLEIVEVCPLLSESVNYSKAIDEMRYDVLPQLYWTSAIPLVVLMMAIAWLTTVESASIRLIKSVGYAFVSAILLQVILQLALLAHFHGRMTQIVNKVDRSSKEIVAGDGISWAVWTIFILYSLFNVFGVPVILSYIDRRERQEALLGPKTESEIEFESTLDRLGMRNRSFRIEDDPMGDNFRQQLAEIQGGIRDTSPRTPTLSRVTSLADDSSTHGGDIET